MLQLLNPIWLLAGGAILIPLLIHLWNVKQGKTLKIGSIRLLGESSKQNSRSFRLQDLWLLLLRCVILIVLALLMAGPAITEKFSGKKARGWVLLDSAYVRESYEAFKPRIDSLLRAGYETHYFNTGFQGFDLAEVQKNQPAGQGGPAAGPSYWSLAQALDKILPSHTNAYVFTTNRLNRFSGARPSLASKIHWYTFTSGDSIYNKIASAYLTRADSLMVSTAQYRPGSIVYSAESTSLENMSPAYKFAGNERTSIRFNSPENFKNKIDSAGVLIDTAVLRIALFSDKYPADLAYLKAAFEAVQAFSRRRISIRTYRNQNDLPVKSDWLFWLSESPANNDSKKRAENIFTYTSGKTTMRSKSEIISLPGLYAPERTGLYKTKQIKYPNLAGRTIWEDETGEPLLVETADDKTSEFNFYSRFDPEWNDLVWTPQFPELLLELISKQTNHADVTGINDRRTIAPEQITPATLGQKATAQPGPEVKKTNLDRYFWLLLMILFGLERWISHKRFSIDANV